MNVFILAEDINSAIQSHANIHLHKMILESAQMLSTTHRILDGNKIPNTRHKYVLNNSELDSIIYKATHPHHPWTKWTMETESNYKWHYLFFVGLCQEYKFRRNRTHLTETKLKEILKTPPKNIPKGDITAFPLAVDDDCITDDVIQTYRNHYIKKASRMKMEWSPRAKPEWFDV